MGLNLEVTRSPVAILVGPHFFVVFLFILYVKSGASQKIVAQIRGDLVMEGVTLGPLRPPPHSFWANPRYVPGQGA